MSEVTEEQPKGEVNMSNGVNGVAAEDEVLMSEEELERGKLRPADIDQDMKEMERRKRVEAIMNSVVFREELEKIVECQIQEGYSGYQAIQNIYEMMGMPGTRGSMFRSMQSLIPINDIRGLESMAFAKGEKLLRCKLASLYRVIDLHGWTQNIYNHCTARVNQDMEHFLLNPFGLLYHEVTASSLVKVDMQGNIIDPGTTNFGVNIAGFMLHSAIHSARPDIRCIVHIHHPAVVAISVLKLGLLPLSQESLLIGDVSYHDYSGIFINSEEKEILARNLGPVNKVIFLRNHGVVCCGESIEEAWYNTYHTVLACEAQMKMAPLGLDNLILVTDEARAVAFETARKGAGGVDSRQEGGAACVGSKDRKYRVGEIEFEALMRSLDNAGLRSGYIYRRPLVKMEQIRVQSDVALPPSASNYTHLFDEDDISRRKAQDKSRWLNSPNVYQKVEILETGTPDPRKITKWVADGSPTHSTPVKLESALMFVPKDTDPKEFKKIQKLIKENRRIGNISAGPTSHLLEGVSWEEAQKMQDAGASGAVDHVILVGAASKGIIQRDFQHNAVVYKTPYAKNPFDAVSDQELEEYKQAVLRKQREPEEIEVEQMNITRQVATRDVVDDATQEGGVVNSTGMMSPLSEEVNKQTGPKVTEFKVEAKVVPRASQAQPVIIMDDIEKTTRPKPPVPPKPSLTKVTKPLLFQEGVPVGPPQKVNISVKMLPDKGETVPDGEETEAHHSTLSQSSKEGSPTKDTSLTDDSVSKEKKKKKKGLRTPSFLKKKKDKKKEKEATHQ